MKREKAVVKVVDGCLEHGESVVLGGEAVHEAPVWYPDEEGRWQPGFYVGDVGVESRIVRGDGPGCVCSVVRKHFVMVRRLEENGWDKPK